MIYRNWMRLTAVLIGLQAASSFAQDEKPAPKRPPARPVSTAKPAKPADPAKDAPKPKPQTATTTAEAKPVPTQATVEMIMNEAVKNIAKRYNLNEAQKQKTDEIMKRDVNKFLKDHEAQVWPIIRDLMSNGFQPSSNTEDVKRIGNAAAPLLKEAQKAILDGNQEWRQYLTPEQKTMHDYDLGEMEKQFVEVEKGFKSWADGKPVGGLFPAPALDRSPPTPKMPTAGLPKPPPPPPEPEVEIFVHESLFDSFVEDFIKQYQLDPAQIDAARSILAEFKVKAGAFKESNRTELTRIANEQKAAMDGKDRDRIARAEADRKKLLEPVYVLFGEMDERLKALLTSAQLERHGARQDVAPKIDPLNEISPVQAAPPPSAPPRTTDKAKSDEPPPQKTNAPKIAP